MFSGSRKIPTLGSTVQWETRQASFPNGTVGPRVGIFLSPLNTNDGFYLSHIPVPACWRDKYPTATLRLHTSHMMFPLVIVMLKWRQHVTFQRIQDFLEAFFIFFKYKMLCLVVSKKRIHYSCEAGIEKSVPHDHRFHLSALLVMPIGDPPGRFFYPTLTLMMDPYSDHKIKIFVLSSISKTCFRYP